MIATAALFANTSIFATPLNPALAVKVNKDSAALTWSTVPIMVTTVFPDIVVPFVAIVGNEPPPKPKVPSCTVNCTVVSIPAG